MPEKRGPDYVPRHLRKGGGRSSGKKSAAKAAGAAHAGKANKPPSPFADAPRRPGPAYSFYVEAREMRLGFAAVGQ